MGQALTACLGGDVYQGPGQQQQPAQSDCERILYQYEDYETLLGDMRGVGLESSTTAIGIDFSKSNERTGQFTFNAQCLHSISQQLNPYEQVLCMLSKTMTPFSDDHAVPCYGFADATTRNTTVFSFFPENRPALGLNGVASRYRQIAPLVQLSGPTSFEPVIRQAIRTVVFSQMRYHILVIIADGPVTPDCWDGTIHALITASYVPLSIILVGVGDGPWDQMDRFQACLKQRAFDNFTFVEFSKVLREGAVYKDRVDELERFFAVCAFTKIPKQYTAIAKLKLMDRARVREFNILGNWELVLGPPATVLMADQQALGAANPLPNI